MGMAMGMAMGMVTKTRRLRTVRDISGWALVMGAGLCALLLPPLVAFEPQRPIALALAGLGAALTLAPYWFRSRLAGVRRTTLHARTATGWVPHSRWLEIVGVIVLWGVVAWCVFSQAAPLTAARSQVWSARALPLALLVALWLWVRLPRDWQRRGLLGVALPSVVSLGIVAWPAPPRAVDFAPYYLALDSHGTLYASDAHAAVIREFAPDGSLQAKLRPGLASRAGPPGPGLSPPGPYNDPDRLGVARATPGAHGLSAPLQPWPVGADDFWFCGMAMGPGDRLYVPDWMRGRMLRFAPNGHLEVSWALPAGYQPSLGCTTVAGAAPYLSDSRGAVLRLDPADGHVLQRWDVGEPILGGISATPEGDAIYALARSRVYRIDLRAGTLISWALPSVPGPLGQPYQAILALGDGRVLLADLAARRVDVFTSAGQPLGAFGRRGAMPGEFGQVGGLARDVDGWVYIADSDARVVQRFTPHGRIDALYWSPDDDEIE